MDELINNDKIFSYKIKKESKLFDFLKEDLVVSMRLTNSLIKDKNMFINDLSVKKNTKINKNDVLKIVFKDEIHNYEEQNIPIDIVYEDNDIIVINKDPGIVVHSTKDGVNDTLANAVAYYFKKIGLKRKIRFINRLDMDTSGLLLVAKNPYAHQYIAKQFESEETEKVYVAAVCGKLDSKEGIINRSILRDKEKGRYVIHPNGKISSTTYSVLREEENYSVVECKLVTGRTHQIRVHLSSIGHPILGDSLYGTKSDLINRQALHAYRLTFKLPRSHEEIKLEAPIPTDFII